MSHTLDVRALTRDWYRENPAHRAVAPGENRLLEVLYRAYCLRTGEASQWSRFSEEKDYRRVCGKLRKWYQATYVDRFQMPAGGKGQKRNALPSRKEYSFHAVYTDSRTFTQYLIEGRHEPGSQTLYAFALHMAVAFLVPPDQLDEVLQKLGFHPLHVKNLHHLAIYYVLLQGEKSRNDPDFNPFDRVRELYFRALDKMKAPAPKTLDAYSYAEQLTRMIREALFISGRISRENFDNLVLLNKDALNKRHSLILQEFRRLTAVFFHVFDDPQFSAEDPAQDDASEAYYSFYGFVGRYCHAYLDRKHFRHWLKGLIDQKDKHPTRNMMILLWLYVHCFAYHPGIYVEPRTFDRIRQKLRETAPELADSMDAYYALDHLDIYGLIMGAPQRRVRRDFDGADLLAEINGRLMAYGWGALNRRLPFDHYIMQLKDLMMYLEHDGEVSRCLSIRYGDAPLTGIPTEMDNVPCPLVAINWIMHHLKNHYLLETPQKPCPLESNLYEQI